MLAFLGDYLAKNLFALLALARFGREKNDARAILSFRRNIYAAGGPNFLEKGMGRLHQDARAVAGVGFATAGAAVVQVQENGDGLSDDFVGFPALDVDNETHAAGLVFELRIVKPLFGGQSVPSHVLVFLLLII